VQFADNLHASDEILERYSMNRLDGPELAEFEEHLLVCERCQDRLAQEDTIRRQVRYAGAKLRERPAKAGRRLPKLAWAFALAAIAIAGIWWQSPGRSTAPPAVIFLKTMRGVENPTQPGAPAGRPLTLVLDLTDLQRVSAYALEIVDAGGHPVFRSSGTSLNGKLQTTLTHGLAAGAYFVRVYSPARELLREYALAVRG
jgi:hypothetical protein